MGIRSTCLWTTSALVEPAGTSNGADLGKFKVSFLWLAGLDESNLLYQTTAQYNTQNRTTLPKLSHRSTLQCTKRHSKSSLTTADPLLAMPSQRRSVRRRHEAEKWWWDSSSISTLYHHHPHSQILYKYGCKPAIFPFLAFLFLNSSPYNWYTTISYENLIDSFKFLS